MPEESKFLAVGIDLGTTYSCIAYVDSYGKPVVVKNCEGGSTTPSVVQLSHDPNEIVVGTVAKGEKANLPGELIVEFVKRSMGKENWKHMVDGREYRAEEISAYILKKMVKDAAEQIGPITQAVITCPAYFGINEREATAQAGTLAGLQGYILDAATGIRKCNIIPEPTAAAFYYGLAKARDNETVMVYDLGGGTFDVTLLEVTKEAVNALCIGGDHELGGKDWDDLMANYVLDCARESGIDSEAVYSDSMALGDLMLRVEEAKKILTAKEKATVNFTFGKLARVEISRQKFDELTAPKLDRTILLCRDMLKEAAGLGYTAFDRILLVGGSTRMPQVRRRLEAEFPGIPIEFNEPDEAVAKGAALFAQKLMVDEQVQREIDTIFQRTGRSAEAGKSLEEVKEANPEVVREAMKNTAARFSLPTQQVEMIAGREVGDITSKSFGIQAYNAQDRLTVANLIRKNAKLPASVTQSFFTRADSQASAELTIMESKLLDEEIELVQAQEISKAVLPLPSGLPAGSPIEITFDLDRSGLLKFRGCEITSNNLIEGEIQTTAKISEAEATMALQRVNAANVS
ncbi:MAG: Hsp70 family protein [Candidatus Zixiibacteriota bacterium]|nr:MAG: Hsp70 family protein [candidate division Zixibacteria bacterium]